MTVEIREVRQEDISEVKRLVARTWGIDGVFDDRTSLEVAASLFVNTFLHNGTFGRVAVLNEEIVGLIIGSARGDAPRLRMLTEEPIELIAGALGLEEADVTRIQGYLSTIFTSYEKLLSPHKENYQGCLELFVVDTKARGNQVGKRLLQELTTYFYKHRVETYYLFTDTNCTYGFYDHNGFTRREKEELTLPFTIDHQPAKMTNFLYDYTLH
ncbi:GNAT family N-acetyltransferase [Paenalkalicoccus suaedae]|uniref:GNAT family N-acetyltransferase n=1 Tax=Paenalkalicoccus suaedae TaxID=2592382 RepID=A0A859FAU7_9BACI|nr:GNAT family N-acetyltransferase [Paenalkalicoccus suaedae]QKS69902.1 GNAT family N-acetyltransferase [Paenalkalicoccus suaedae]